MICTFIDLQRAAGRGVESVCRVLRELGLAIAPRTYRTWRTRPASGRTVGDAGIVDRLLGLRASGPAGRPAPEILYGRRKMTVWLNRQMAAQGRAPVSKHTVDRLMRLLGMNGLVRGRGVRTTVPARKDARRATDLLNRCFSAPRPNHAWVTDFTYVATWSGFVYVAFAVDLYSRAIVGWSASSVKDVAFIEACLKMALWRRGHTGRTVGKGLIHHSDAGGQYTSIRFTETLALEGLCASIGSIGVGAHENLRIDDLCPGNSVKVHTIGSIGDAYDTAAADSPFRDGPLRDQPDVERLTLEYVHWYNNERLHSGLDGYHTPEEYEQTYYTQQSGTPTGAAAKNKAA